MRNCSMICPAKETPRDSIWLTVIDLIKRTPYTHTPLVYIYDHPTSITSSKHFFNSALLGCVWIEEFGGKGRGGGLQWGRSQLKNGKDLHLPHHTPPPLPFKFLYPNTPLKSSLSEVLVPFYPLAGRLRKNDETGRIEIDCNAKGVLFVETETSYKLSDFGDFIPNDKLRKLVIPSCDYSAFNEYMTNVDEAMEAFEGLTNIPLLMVQLTRFRCGGVTPGFGMHHFVGDGFSYVYFINQWARLARGFGLTVSPVFHRTCALVARNPPQVKFDHLEFEQRPSELDMSSGDFQQKEETRVGLFKFSKDEIMALRRQAIMPMSSEHKYSTFEVIAAHVWRCALKARGLKEDVLVRFSTPVNGRSKFKHPPVPQGYFCNVIFSSVDIASSGEVVSKPLWYTASIVHEAVIKVDEEYMRSAVDFLSIQPDLMALASGPHSSKYPNIHVNYWKGMPFYEADFGWGKPVFVRHGGIGYEGQAFIIPSADGDTLELR